MKDVKTFLVTLAFLVMSVSSAMAQHPPLGGGNGSTATPYLINDHTHLKAFADFVNAGGGTETESKYYKVTADIDLSSYSNWEPVGNNSTENNTTRFRGNFDGNGKVVKNLRINKPDQDDIGLFGNIGEASIKNLGVENGVVIGKGSTGVLLGVSSRSTITDCYATGTVTGRYVGGLVGYSHTNSTITNCYATVTVTGTHANVGGLAGRNDDATITNCYATGTVSGTEANVGGLVGHNSGNTSTITNCYATGNVSGTEERVGGLVGYHTGNLIKNCVAANSSVTTTYSTTTLIHRVIGDGDGSKQNNYANSNMKVQNGSGNVTQTNDLDGVAGMGKTLAELQTELFYTTQGNWNGGVWDFGEVWDICEGKTLPWLKWQDIDCETVGIRNTTMVQTKVYPNPTTGELRIENYELEIGNIQIFDLMGRAQKVESSKTATEIMLNISHLPSGVYFLKIETSSGAITQKVIKE